MTCGSPSRRPLRWTGLSQQKQRSWKSLRGPTLYEARNQKIPFLHSSHDVGGECQVSTNIVMCIVCLYGWPVCERHSICDVSGNAWPSLEIGPCPPVCHLGEGRLLETQELWGSTSLWTNPLVNIRGCATSTAKTFASPPECCAHCWTQKC